MIKDRICFGDRVCRKTLANPHWSDMALVVDVAENCEYVALDFPPTGPGRWPQTIIVPTTIIRVVERAWRKQ